MAVAVPHAAPGMGVRAYRRPGWIAAIVAMFAMLLVAAGAAGWAMRGSRVESTGDAAARYEAMVGPVNDRCTGGFLTEAEWNDPRTPRGACDAALLTFAAGVRAGVWPDAAMDEARKLATAAETHAGWLARMDAATTWSAHQVIVGEILAEKPLPWIATATASRAFRNALGLLGGPTPLV